MEIKSHKGDINDACNATASLTDGDVVSIGYSDQSGHWHSVTVIARRNGLQVTESSQRSNLIDGMNT